MYMFYTYNAILLSYTKEWSADTYYKVNEPWKRYAWWEKPDKKSYTYWVILLTWNNHNRQIHRDRKQIGGCQGLQGNKNEEVTV